jgi:hypothetical protein
MVAAPVLGLPMATRIASLRTVDARSSTAGGMVALNRPRCTWGHEPYDHDPDHLCVSSHSGFPTRRTVHRPRILAANPLTWDNGQEDPTRHHLGVGQQARTQLWRLPWHGCTRR